MGRLLGRLYAGAGAPGGGGAPPDAEPGLDPLLDPGPEPGAEGGGGGLLTRSVPALTCSLSDCCCACLNSPNEPEAAKPGPGPVGGVAPNGPVPENWEVGVCGPLSYPLSNGSMPWEPPTLKVCENSCGLLFLGGGGGGATGMLFMPAGPKGGKLLPAGNGMLSIGGLPGGGPIFGLFVKPFGTDGAATEFFHRRGFGAS